MEKASENNYKTRRKETKSNKRNAEKFDK